jgi:hypothetical protein
MACQRDRVGLADIGLGAFRWMGPALQGRTLPWRPAARVGLWAVRHSWPNPTTRTATTAYMACPVLLPLTLPGGAMAEPCKSRPAHPPGFGDVGGALHLARSRHHCCQRVRRRRQHGCVSRRGKQRHSARRCWAGSNPRRFAIRGPCRRAKRRGRTFPCYVRPLRCGAITGGERPPSAALSCCAGATPACTDSRTQPALFDRHRDNQR